MREIMLYLISLLLELWHFMISFIYYEGRKRKLEIQELAAVGNHMHVTARLHSDGCPKRDPDHNDDRFLQKSSRLTA